MLYGDVEDQPTNQTNIEQNVIDAAHAHFLYILTFFIFTVIFFIFFIFFPQP